MSRARELWERVPAPVVDLVLVAEGLSNADIGARIHLGAGTVKDHVSAILTKLRVTSRVQAALLAQRAGLLDERPQSQARR